MHRMRYVKPISSFRSHWEYQNNMYGDRRRARREASPACRGTGFIQTRIFDPLGMTESIPLVAEIARQAQRRDAARAGARHREGGAGSHDGRDRARGIGVVERIGHVEVDALHSRQRPRRQHAA